MEWNELKKEFDSESILTEEWLKKEFAKILSGRVNINIFNDIKVDAYGEFMKINQLANIQVLDARTVTIKPYDRNLISEVAKSINNSNLKVNPQVNPDNIKIIFQPPTEENRKLNVKNAKQYYEQAKTKIKNIRQDVRKKYKSIDGLSEDLIRNFDEELDKITKLYNSKLEKIFNDKEEELMKI